MKISRLLTSAILACLITSAANADLKQRTTLKDKGLAEIEQVAQKFSNDVWLGMSFVSGGGGTYDSAADLSAGAIADFIIKSAMIQNAEELTTKVTKIATVKRDPLSIKTSVSRAMKKVYDVVGRNQDDDKLTVQVKGFDKELKSKTIRWVMGNRSASVENAILTIAEDGFTWIEAGLIIYIQPETKEFLILLSAVEND